MRGLTRIQLRIRSLLLRSKVENDLNDELRDYVERETERQIAAGAKPDEARKLALASLHGVERVKEECRDARGVHWVETTVSDLQFAFRTLRKTPAFTITTIAALAFCIGLNTTIFSVVDTVLFRPLPFPDQDRLVALTEGVPALGFPVMPFACPDYLFVSANSRSFTSTAVYLNQEYEMAGIGRPSRIQGARVSASLFHVLEVSPAVGRSFSSYEDDHLARVAVLGDGLARNVFGEPQAAIGRRILLDRISYQVIGVMPPSFSFPVRGSRFNGDPAELFVPVSWSNEDRTQTVSNFDYSMIARLRQSVTVQQANAEVRTLIKRLVDNYTPAIKQMLTRLPNFSLEAQVTPFRQEFTGNVQRPLMVLLGAVAVILLIGCSDVTNLILTRMAARRREFAVRAALGAGSWRLVRQTLTEGLLLSVAGGVTGLCVACGLLPLLIRFAPDTLPRANEIGLNWRMAAFVAAVTLVTPLIFCMTPFMTTMRRISAIQLHGEGRTITRSRRERLLMSSLVIAQFSLAFVLLTTAGLLLRSFVNAMQTNPGFEPEHVISMRITLPTQAYKNPVQIRSLFNGLLAEIGTLPGVRQAGAMSDLPMSSTSNVILTAKESARTEKVDTLFTLGSVLRALGVQLIEGRLLEPDDYVGKPHVAVISESVAKRIWPKKNPIGRQIKFGVDDPMNDQPWLTVVGVVADVKAQLTDKSPRLVLFTTPADWVNAMNVIVRTDGNPIAIATTLRRKVAEADPDLAVGRIATIDELLNGSLSAERFRTWLLMCFAVAAMSLATLGIGGVIAYNVGQRVQEFGIRVAVGAKPRSLAALVLEHCSRLCGAGLLIGIGAALLVTRTVSALLYETSPLDPATFAAVAVVMILFALGASAIPIWRVLHLDPISSLKAE